MSSIDNGLLTFHSYVSQAYSSVHEWLSSRVPDYRKNSARNRVKKQLEDPTLESAALQYYVLFPGHFFKVAYAIDNIIGKERLVDWLEYNPQIIVIDVGCGAGAATAALVNSLLHLHEADLIQQNVSVSCVGIDLNRGAIALYNQLLSQIKQRIEGSNIDLQYKLIPHGDLQAINRLRDILNEQRKDWQKPYLTHVLLMQANVVSPFSKRYQNTSTDYSELEEWGVDLNLLVHCGINKPIVKRRAPYPCKSI